MMKSASVVNESVHLGHALDRNVSFVAPRFFHHAEPLIFLEKEYNKYAVWENNHETDRIDALCAFVNKSSSDASYVDNYGGYTDTKKKQECVTLPQQLGDCKQWPMHHCCVACGRNYQLHSFFCLAHLHRPGAFRTTPICR